MRAIWKGSEYEKGKFVILKDEDFARVDIEATQTVDAVALDNRSLLDDLGLASFPKTSGSKGLQLTVPLNTPVTCAETKPFAEAVAELLESRRPQAVVSRMAKKLRPGKVFID
jgi:DNA primase